VKFSSPDEASALDEIRAGAANAPTPAAEVFRKLRRLTVFFFTNVSLVLIRWNGCL
jgi:hypothetical protein